MAMDETTNAIWRKYQKSHDYMMKSGLVSRTERNWKFYLGDQWTGLQSGGEKLPTMNFIKPIVKYKVATISQNAMTANFSDASSAKEQHHDDLYKEFNRRFSLSWEKAKMTAVGWENNKAAAIQGESYVYFGSSDTNERPQILGNTMVLFGDENITDIQEQPYIIIRERLSIDQVIKRAKENGIPDEEIQTIHTDADREDVVNNKDEVSDKVTSLLYMEKRNGIVHVARATRDCIYQPLEALSVKRNGEVIGGMKSYPLVGYVWEEQPNSARGIGEVDTLIPNQIELNKTLARRAMAVKLAAYPRIAYDTTAIENPEDLDKVGKAIGVTTGNAQSINQAISYLNAANISSDAYNLFNDLLDQTKDLNGAGDNALGNINPERASGQAILAVRDQTQVPLNEQINGYQQFVEDVAMLWLDIWSTYDPEGFTVENTDPQTGETIEEVVPYEELVSLKTTVRVDVSQDNRWTKLAEQQAADSLLSTQQISFDEWVQLCAENGALPKAKLLKIVEQRKERMELQAEQEQMAMEQGQMLPPPEESASGAPAGAPGAPAEMPNSEVERLQALRALRESPGNSEELPAK